MSTTARAPRKKQPPPPILAFDVPGKPVSANARLGYNGRRKFLTKEARDWRETVMDEAWAAFIAARQPPIQPPLRVVCHVRGVRGDADNYAKLILDGLAEGIGIDDKHFAIVEMHATAKGLKQPGVLIEVYEAARGRGEAA